MLQAFCLLLGSALSRAYRLVINEEIENFTLVNSVGQNLKFLTKFKLVTFQRPDQWVRALFSETSNVNIMSE